MRRNASMPDGSGGSNALERLIQRFQGRWETDRQFRAAWSGVAALIVVISLCACLGTVSTVVTRTVAGFTGASGGTNALGTPNTGVGQVSAAKTFPTATSGELPAPQIPGASPIASSLTPQPSATVPPTVTAAPTATTGGGGGGPLVCSGTSNGSWTLSPCPQIHGRAGSLTIVNSSYPGRTVNVILTFCDTNCALLFTPDQGYKLDGSGTCVINYTVPANANGPSHGITGYVNISGGPTMNIDASPAQ